MLGATLNVRRLRLALMGINVDAACRLLIVLSAQLARE